MMTTPMSGKLRSISVLPPRTGSQIVTLAGIRADVSGLEDGDTILATISATGTGDGFSDITETAGSSAAGMVSTVKDGINVTAVGQISVLTCDADTTSGRMPSIKVEEGFNAAWETDAAGIGETATSDTQIQNRRRQCAFRSHLPMAGPGQFDGARQCSIAGN